MRGSAVQVVLEVLEGVGPFLHDEISRSLPELTVVASEPTELRVTLPDSEHGSDSDAAVTALARQLQPLLALRTAVAAYLPVDLDIRRPRGLLSPDHLNACLHAISVARRVAKPARFGSFRLSAAGSDSKDLLRFREEVEKQTGLIDDPDGDLLLRLRHTPATDAGTAPSGWQLLVRLTPRPLSTRAWRVANYPGALNATVAAAVVDTTDPSPDDRFLDLMCGSGTLVVERLARGRPARLVACDRSPDALAAAEANQRASKQRGRVEYVEADARSLPFQLGSFPAAAAPGSTHAAGAAKFDRLVVNLPWGELVGEHAVNDELYPAVLQAAARLADDRAVFCVLTQDYRRFDRALDEAGFWSVANTWRFFQKGHRPKLYRLIRR